ncbi:MAG: protein jag [Capsulimonadaceae bacterium]
MTFENDKQKAAISQARECLCTILNEGGLSVDVNAVEAPGCDISLVITGPDADYLVGPQGHTLDALQHLLTLIVNHHRDSRLRVWVDAAGYRARRVETLSRFANQLADEVVGSGQEAITDPLNPVDRRIIHTALAERMDVQTYSEGEEPHRYIVVSPRQE